MAHRPADPQTPSGALLSGSTNSAETAVTVELPEAPKELCDYVDELLRWQEESTHPDLIMGVPHRARVG